jgi:hypothetical protein
MVYGHWACKTSQGTQSSRNGGKINKTKQCGKPEGSFRMVIATRGLALSKGKTLEFCDLCTNAVGFVDKISSSECMAHRGDLI